MKRTKGSSPVSEFLDALADVIAERVATKMTEASKPVPPRMVPKWLPGPEKPARRRRGLVPKGEEPCRTAERALRDSGFVTYGDPGYDRSRGERVETVSIGAEGQAASSCNSTLASYASSPGSNRDGRSGNIRR